MKSAWTRLALRAAIVSAGVLGALVFFLAIALWTAPGHATVARLITFFSDGDVVVHGLSGDLPNHLRADSVELHDAKGPWLRIQDVQLDWDALALLGDHVDISHVQAGSVAVLRRRVHRESGSSSSTRIDIADLRIARLEIAAAIAGQRAILTASGSLHYVSRHDVAANITIKRLDTAGSYRVDASIRDDIVRGTAAIAENGSGIAGGLVGLPDIGPVSLDAQANVTGNLNQITVDLRAGDLTMTERGMIDLGRRTIDGVLSVSAPAMQPRKDLAWASLTANGVIHGPFDSPQIDVKLAIQKLAAAGFTAGRIDATVRGAQGTAQLAGTVDGLTIPGGKPDTFAAAPVQVSARADLDAKTRPITFELDHPLLRLTGRADTRGTRQATATLDIPSLAPVAALAGIDLGGSAKFTAKASHGDYATALAVNGTIDTDEKSALARLLGHRATLDLSGTLQGSQIAAAQGTLAGAAASAHLAGAANSGTLNYRWNVSLADVSRLVATLRGRLDLHGTLAGETGKLKLAATGDGMLGTRQFAEEKVAVELNADGLPRVAKGTFRISGRFGGAPLIAAGHLARDRAGALDVSLERMAWKSLTAQAALAIPRDGAREHGKASLKITNLADLAPLIGVKLAGALSASADVRPQNGHAVASIKASGHNLQLTSVHIDSIDTNGTIDDAFGRPVLVTTIKTEGWQAQGFSGKATVALDGPFQNLVVKLTTDIATPEGEPLSIAATAALDTQTHAVVLRQLHGSWRGRPLALVAPATVNYADGLAVDRLGISYGDARLDAAGRIRPNLAFSLTAQNVTPGILPLAGEDAMSGTFSATAKLSGTLEAPAGSFELHGKDLRARGTSRKTAPNATLDAHGTLQKGVVMLDAKLTGDKALGLALGGDVPLDTKHPLKLHVGGDTDLGLFGGLLAATGQSLTGTATVDATVTGTLARPLVTGSAKLAHGDFRDYANGVRLRDIEASAEAGGDVIHITKLSARVGSGTVSGSGTVDLSSAEMPVDIVLTAKNAQALAGDRLAATLDADLKVTGHATRQLAVSGDVRLLKGDIHIPDKLPPSVAVLNVRRMGEAPPPPPSPGSTVRLDLTVSAPNRIFVRGRGLDAELGGQIKISGTATDPRVLGGLELQRGTLSLAGQTLDIQSGKVSFDGSGLRNRLDPTLDFTAQTSSNGVTATLKVTGHASAPQIQLTSSPELPQDEILARLLFQQSVGQLTPVQMTQIAEALASLSGIGNGFDPVGTLRRSLGLDRLAIGSTSAAGSSASQTTIEAGKYLTHNIYVGARQDLSGGTRVVVEMNVMKNLKARATVNTGTPPTATGTPLTDNGDSVGLSYQFEY